MTDDDLTEYERLRLENIRRNNAFLKSIGFDWNEESESKSKITAKSLRTNKDTVNRIKVQLSPKR